MVCGRDRECRRDGQYAYIVIVGIGELGGVFAKAFLRKGLPVYPITRRMNISEQADHIPQPELVLVAVAERDFKAVMATIPYQWRNCIGLLQNELLPRDWKAYHIVNPTIISVWFEKKKGWEFKVLIPSPVHGPKAGLIAESLEAIEIPSKILSSKPPPTPGKQAFRACSRPE